MAILIRHTDCQLGFRFRSFASVLEQLLIGGQRKSKIDVVGGFQGEIQHCVSGFPLDLPQGCLPRLRILRRDDEPQVQPVFSFVVVVDFGTGTDPGRYRLQFVLRNGHGGEGAGTGRVGADNEADTAQHSSFMQPIERLQNLRLAAP